MVCVQSLILIEYLNIAEDKTKITSNNSLNVRHDQNTPKRGLKKHEQFVPSCVQLFDGVY